MLKLTGGAFRFVLIIGPLVFKVPKIRFFRALGSIFHRSQVFRKKYIWKMCLFGGLMENAREIYYYFTTRHKLLNPICLPLLFVNVYPRRDGVGEFDFGGGELGERVLREWGRETHQRFFLPCSHTFDFRQNLALERGRVFILDYGESGFKNLLEQHGDRMEQLLLSVARGREE